MKNLNLKLQNKLKIYNKSSLNTESDQLDDNNLITIVNSEGN